jgi:hypothetical protein
MSRGIRKQQVAARVVRWNDIGLTYQADLTALTITDMARAWIAGQVVYKVHTLTVTQWLTRQWPSPVNVAAVIDRVQVGAPARDTYLVGHHCPGPLVCIDQALTTWQPDDAAVFQPAPTPARITEGMPF